MGPSGSGKSTLLNVLGLIDSPSDGSYQLDGMDVAGRSVADLAVDRNRFIGFVFQAYNLLNELTALENVELPLIYRGVDAQERTRAATEALERVGLGQRSAHKPSMLSGGEQQRAAIARALVSRPRLLLVDEPTGALDRNSGQDVLGLLAELHREGRTIVMVTHDPEVAAAANRIIRLCDGRVDGFDSPGLSRELV